MKIEITENIPGIVKMQADFVHVTNGGRFGLYFWGIPPEPENISLNMSDDDFTALICDDEENVIVKIVWTPENEQDKEVLNHKHQVLNEYHKDSVAWFKLKLDYQRDTFKHARINMLAHGGTNRAEG